MRIILAKESCKSKECINEIDPWRTKGQKRQIKILARSNNLEREILELVLKAEEKNIYVAYNYDTNTNTLTIITKTKVFAFKDNEYIEEWSEECIQYLKSLIGERTE